MLSPIPGVIAWPAIGLVAAVLAGRSVLMRDTVVDQLINRLFLWGLLSLLRYRCAMAPGVASLAHQLALGCTVMSSMCLQGIVRVWAFDADPVAVWRRHRVCGVVAAGCAATILLAGTSARHEGRLVDLSVSRGTSWCGPRSACPCS
ncbi:hypothetical protein AB0M45_08170 [Nocardia sp. NPDC051787]|uniref:hypothetical protein n=1 Tax=Nocardia sp. NPDC051787 TaxID=3155415 RepID=UPI003446B1CA